MLEAQNANPPPQHQQVDIDDLLDDPELERLHAERLYALQKEVEKRAALQRRGHGELQTVEEGQFLQVNIFLNSKFFGNSLSRKEQFQVSESCCKHFCNPVT